MKKLEAVYVVLASSLIALVTAGTMPAFGTQLDDVQAPRGQTTAMNAALDNRQAPRGQDVNVSATRDDPRRARS